MVSNLSQGCLEVVSKLSQTRPKLFQSCPKYVSKLVQVVPSGVQLLFMFSPIDAPVHNVQCGQYVFLPTEQAETYLKI